ncbi:HEAT repeat domain-containing protein [Trichothermofontia sichuanensis B231]|uniref:HEAT repeat domain-containing protein n=1 Tax=Trichothermofontia sichuanensis TaxID=3045816 RepID=UPI0022452627|nr:HEAT repeat domain-containing protein [Trichothermofontia sichuanensis]UZQ54865.1 HEAT repeat domain-containing protein [Trichothermofontia sichuanensis B231]
MQGTNFENASDLSLVDTASDESSLTVEQAIANLRGPDSGLRYYAAWWLGRFRVGTPEAIAALIESLADDSDRTAEGGYPLRRNAARALGKLGDTQAVPALIECLACDDFYVREAAAQALGSLGDRRAIPPLMALLDGGLAAAQPLGDGIRLRHPYAAILEALGELEATEAIALIEPFLDHPFELLQYAAARAMYALTQESVYAERLVRALSGDKLPLRRAALADLGAIGYTPAATAIAQTLAENSLKLIALKGLLEKQVQQIPLPTLSEEARRIMALMDELL